MNCQECKYNLIGECQLSGLEIPRECGEAPSWCPELVEQRFWDYIDDKNDEKRLEDLCPKN